MIQYLTYNNDNQGVRGSNFVAMEWLLKRMRKALSAKGWSKAEFGRRMDLNTSAINRRMAKGNFTVEELLKAQKVLGIKIFCVDSEEEGGALLATEEPTSPQKDKIKFTIELGAGPEENQEFIKRFTEALIEVDERISKKRNNRD